MKGTITTPRIFAQLPIVAGMLRLLMRTTKGLMIHIAYCLASGTSALCSAHIDDRYNISDPSKKDAQKWGLRLFPGYVLVNKLLGGKAGLYAFVSSRRYGILGWATVILKEAKDFPLKGTGRTFFAYEYAGIPGAQIYGLWSNQVFRGKRAPVIGLCMLLTPTTGSMYLRKTPGDPSDDHFALMAPGSFRDW